MHRVLFCASTVLSIATAASAAEPLLESLRKQHAIVGDFIVRAAEKAPDADYDFRPTEK